MGKRNRIYFSLTRYCSFWTLILLYDFPFAKNNKHIVVFKISIYSKPKKKKRMLAVYTYILILELIKIPEVLIIIVIVIVTNRAALSP